MNTPDITPSLGNDDEIDLLDLLLVLADNIKLLIITPVICGLLGLAAAYLLTPTYESKSVYSTKTQEKNIAPDLLASYLRSPTVLHQAGKSLQIDPSMSDERLIKKLEKMVAVSIGRQDQLLTLTTQGSSAEAAQALNQALWQIALPLTIPQGKDMERLQTRMAAEKERLASGLKLEQEIAERLQNGNSSESNARLYGELLSSNSTRLSVISGLQAQVEGLTETGFIQRPSLPEQPLKPNKGLIAIAAALAGGLLILIFIFVRHALRSASQHPDQAVKLKKIRQSLGLKH